MSQVSKLTQRIRQLEIDLSSPAGFTEDEREELQQELEDAQDELIRVKYPVTRDKEEK